MNATTVGTMPNPDRTLARRLAEQDAQHDPAEQHPVDFWTDAYTIALRFSDRARFVAYRPYQRRERYARLVRAGANLN